VRAALARFPAGSLAVAVAGIVACAGCYDPNLRDCEVKCQSPADCPRPFTCGSSGFCAAPGYACAPANDGGDGPEADASRSDVPDASDAPDAMSLDRPEDLVDAMDHPHRDHPSPVPINAVCDHSKPFEPPVLIDLDAPGPVRQAYNPWLSRDELTMYFAGAGGIYVSTRPELSAPFLAPELVPGLGTFVGRPALTGDELTIYFEYLPGGFGTRVAYSTRPSVDDPWTAPADFLGGPLSTAADGGPFVTVAGDVLYFHSQRAGDLGIFRTEHLDAGWSFPVAVGGISSPYADQNPVVSDDELTIFFASDRPDPAATGGFDIWVATRRSPGDDFDPPSLVPELNSIAFEFPGWLSPDGCRLYFDSSGGLGSGGAEKIYVASRPPAIDTDTDAGAPDATD